jgi:hypothetical protein
MLHEAFNQEQIKWARAPCFKAGAAGFEPSENRDGYRGQWLARPQVGAVEQLSRPLIALPTGAEGALVGGALLRLALVTPREE